VLDLEENFQGTCFSHAFSKTCQYAKTNEKVCKGLQYVSIKVAQKDLQKCITWSKKSRKNRQKWNKARVNLSLIPRKFITPVKTRQTFCFS